MRSANPINVCYRLFPGRYACRPGLYQGLQMRIRYKSSVAAAATIFTRVGGWESNRQQWVPGTGSIIWLKPAIPDLIWSQTA